MNWYVSRRGIDRNAVNENVSSGKVSISKPLYVYICYLVFLSLTDVFALPLFYLNINQFLPAAILMAAVLALCVAVWIHRKFVFEDFTVKKPFFVFSGVIFVVAFLRSILTDVSCDTVNYHVVGQAPGFVDNIHYNVFEGGMGTFMFPLGDRVLYYSRMALGYRLGTLLNALVLILIYYQMVQLFRLLFADQLCSLRESEKKANRLTLRKLTVIFLNEHILAFFSVMLFYSIVTLGTYMVDLLALPLLLWLVNLVLKDADENLDLAQCVLVAAACGFIFALKLTNIVFITPLLLLFLWKNRKHIKIYYYPICIMVGLIPALPYLIYAYTSTGNPIFPFFNQVFKSPYYFDNNFKDFRWGPEDWKQLILWPIHLVLHPEERVSEISKYPQIYLLLGYIGAGGSAIFCIFKRKRTKLLTLSSIFVLVTLAWLVSTGYPRYAILCECLSVVLISGCAIQWLSSTKRLCHAAAFVCILLLAWQCGVNTVNGALNKYSWAWHPEITVQSLKSVYAPELSQLLRDRGTIGTDEQRDRIDVFLSVNVFQTPMKLLDPEAPIVDGTWLVKLNALEEQKGIDYKGYYFDQLRKAEEDGAKIYDVTFANYFDNTIANSIETGVRIISLENVESYFGLYRTVLIGYSMDDTPNTYVHLNEEQQYQIPAGTDQVHVTGLVFMHPIMTWGNGNYHGTLQITASAGEDTIILLERELEEMEFGTLDEVLDVSSLNGEITVSIVDIAGNEWSQAINLEVNAVPEG